MSLANTQVLPSFPKQFFNSSAVDTSSALTPNENANIEIKAVKNNFVFFIFSSSFLKIVFLSLS